MMRFGCLCGHCTNSTTGRWVDGSPRVCILQWLLLLREIVAWPPSCAPHADGKQSRDFQASATGSSAPVWLEAALTRQPAGVRASAPNNGEEASPRLGVHLQC